MECASSLFSSSIFNPPGCSPLTCRKFSPKSRFLSPALPKPFLQLDNRPESFICHSIQVSSSSRLNKGVISTRVKNQSWDLGRFLQTLYFFNRPPSPIKVGYKMETSGIILIAGATGGVGKRVVDILRSKGVHVRALDKTLLYIALILTDITRESTLVPVSFKVFVIGIKFFEPEGDSPQKVEYIGMKILINAVKGNVGLQNGKLIFGFEDNNELPWGALDDIVMGGVSESIFQIDRTGGENGQTTKIFMGVVFTANNGCFASIRTKNVSTPEDLSAYDGLELCLKGDGRRYKLVIQTSSEWDALGYAIGFDRGSGQWQLVRLPFSSLKPIFQAWSVSDAPPFDPTNVVSLQLMFSKFEYGGKLNPTFVECPFQLLVSSIWAYLKNPISPRFIYVGSARVTRPDRPRFDLSKQPLAVHLNKELGSILTFKLKGVDLIRESGIPYAIVRPYALTEKPAGGKISREEVARICIATLESLVIPFSEPFMMDPENPAPEKDYKT
ncbi:hypothetical protein UlMin_000505 [Ulmus minor]